MTQHTCHSEPDIGSHSFLRARKTASDNKALSSFFHCCLGVILIDFFFILVVTMTAVSSTSKISTAVDVELADRAVKALLKHDKSRANEQALLGDDKAIQVQFTLEKIPQNPSHKPIRVLVPHALYKIDADDSNGLEEPSVCLIVKEESKPWVQEMISNFPKEMGFVKKVLGLQSLRKKHARYEQRRELLSRYDVFMADDRILPMLAKSLGKEFFKAKKQPIPIALTRKQALPFVILQSLQSTFLFISSGTTLTVRYVYSNTYSCD